MGLEKPVFNPKKLTFPLKSYILNTECTFLTVSPSEKPSTHLIAADGVQKGIVSLCTSDIDIENQILY